MLTLDQSATSPKAIASLHQCKESVFNISNRSPVRPDGTAGDKSDEFGAALARVGCGQVLLARDRLIEASATARTILEREYRYCTGRETLYSALRQLINRAGAELPIGSMSWLATSTKDGLSRLVSQIINARSDGTSTVILLDLDAHPEPAPGTLRRLFGLTAAETQLAVDLSRGRNLLDIARSRRLSRTTIRSHLAALFVKTQTRRQAELVALLGRIAILP